MEACGELSVDARQLCVRYNYVRAESQVCDPGLNFTVRVFTLCVYTSCSRLVCFVAKHGILRKYFNGSSLVH